MEDYTDHADRIHSFSTFASEVLMRRAIKTTAGNRREEELMHRELERMYFDDLIEWGAEIVQKKKEEDNSRWDGLDEEEYSSDDDQMGYYNADTIVCDDNSDDDQMDYSEKLVFNDAWDEDQTDEEMVDKTDDADATVAAPPAIVASPAIVATPATLDSKFWISVGLGFGLGFGLGLLWC